MKPLDIDLVSWKLWQVFVVFIILGNVCLDPQFDLKNIGVFAISSTDECAESILHKYVEVSANKIWEMKRSCKCCQAIGEKVAPVLVNCSTPGNKKFVKVILKAPLDCMCRPCSTVEVNAIVPQEFAGYADNTRLTSHFIESYTH